MRNSAKPVVIRSKMGHQWNCGSGLCPWKLTSELKEIQPLKFIVIGLLISMMFISFCAEAQSDGKMRTVYAEVLGAGVLGTVNYDFRFLDGCKGLGMRTGIGMIPDVLIIPIELNGLAGKNRLKFEYGLGTSAGIFLQEKPGDQTFSSGINGLGFIGYAKAGIRYLPKKKGLTLSLNYTPMINTIEVWPVWFGLGIGYSWNK
ncbi:MAG: hypothetical protein WCY58_00110 [Mariniphaga sp.]